jgi:hypothetical protein
MEDFSANEDYSPPPKSRTWILGVVLVLLYLTAYASIQICLKGG